MNQFKLSEKVAGEWKMMSYSTDREELVRKTTEKKATYRIEKLKVLEYSYIVAELRECLEAEILEELSKSATFSVAIEGSVELIDGAVLLGVSPNGILCIEHDEEMRDYSDIAVDDLVYILETLRAEL